MTIRIRHLALTAAVVATTSAPAIAQNTSDRTVEHYSCKDVMRDSDTHREIAVAFLHGYLLGKAGTSKFNLDVLAKQTDAFLDGCLDNPKDKAVDVMMKVKK